VLTPWARVEGTFRVGAASAADVVMSLYQDAIHSYGPDVPSIFTSHDVTTDSNGHFIFDRVFPGRGRIGRRILLMVDQGATEITSSMRASAEFEAGETTHLDIGGSGRAVVGRFVAPPGNQGETLWNFALAWVKPALIAPPAREPPAEIMNNREKYSTWRAAYLTSPEGVAWQAAYAAYQRQMFDLPVFEVSVDRDGAFRIDDVPPGHYELSVRASERPVGRLRGYTFSVPEEEQGVVNLGDIQLE
jgi:hypothetical protein